MAPMDRGPEDNFNEEHNFTAGPLDEPSTAAPFGVPTRNMAGSASSTSFKIDGHRIFFGCRNNLSRPPSTKTPAATPVVPTKTKPTKMQEFDKIVGSF